MTGLPGTWLYRVYLPGRALAYWEATMDLDGKVLRRRFASEMHARAWLTITTEPRQSTPPLDLEEFHGPIRTAGVLARSRPPV